ncbi:MAG: hypothetical protein V3V99_10355 [candidate division Zixibacteria bacterium]
MTDGEKKKQPYDSSNERFKYIGFDVFPGKAGNLFKSDEERKSLIEKVMAKFGQSQGEVRDRCTLLEVRVSNVEKMFLAAVSVIMILAIFLPWFSGHFEIVTHRLVPQVFATEAVADTTATEDMKDSTVIADDTQDDAAVTEDPETVVAEQQPIEEALADADSTMADSLMAAGTEEDVIPPNMTTITEVTYDRYSISGIGALISIGTYGSYVFSSGFILILTGILMILFLLSCLGMGAYNLYLLFGVKMKDADAFALHLKKTLKFNWIPVLIWLGMLVLSFIGARYGFDSSVMVTQVGDSYSLMSFIGLTTGGMFVALGAFLVLALKGKEI